MDLESIQKLEEHVATLGTIKSHVEEEAERINNIKASVQEFHSKLLYTLNLEKTKQDQLYPEFGNTNEWEREQWQQK
jgi:hypothetical protein